MDSQDSQRTNTASTKLFLERNPVAVRTMDIGGDKNPFTSTFQRNEPILVVSCVFPISELGNQNVPYTIACLFRASVHGKLRTGKFLMVALLAEFRTASRPEEEHTIVAEGVILNSAAAMLADQFATV